MAPSQPNRRSQTLAGLAILAVLSAIAAGVYLRQFHYDRSMYAPTLNGQAAASQASGASLATGMDLAGLARGLLDPAGRAQTFDAGNLWEKIDGKAEGYLPYGLARLDCLRLALPGQPREDLEVFLYEMNDPQGALSVFTRQRRSGAKSLAGLGPRAYRSGGGVFLAHGRYYAEIRLAGETPALAQAAEELARRLVAGLPAAATVPAELPGRGLLPPEHMKPGSASPMPAEQTGFEKLGRLLTAIYVLDGKQAVAFVAPQANPQRAAELAEEYVTSLAGEGWQAQAGAGPGAKMMGLAGTYRVVFTAGSAVAGVHECEDKAAAVKLAELLKAYMDKRTTTQPAEQGK